MLVRAKKLGYYNHKRIREGEEFMLKPIKGFEQDKFGRTLSAKTFSEEEQFSPNWMEKVDENEDIPQKKEITKRRQALRQTSSEDVI